jgi:ribosomal protein S18 acetylase RimI-like enzyme
MTDMTWQQLLANITWHSLTGPQGHVSTGTDDARRYAPGFSPIVAFADPERPNFAALDPYCEPGEHLYCGGWSGPAPAGWQIDAEATMIKMAWVAPEPAADAAFAAVRLGPEHVPQMLELVALTKPGPFGPRTIELGEYFGVFDGPRLVAMAGERMHAPPLREISGVCTHPDFQGRGLARRLMELLLRREMQRGETPFLHVMRDNRNAHRMYERMGFCDRQELIVRVLSRTP